MRLTHHEEHVPFMDLVAALIIFLMVMLSCGCTRIQTSGDVYQASGFSTVVIADAETSATLTVNANHAPGASWLTAIWAAITGMFGGSK